jgi:MFS family permease
VEYGAVVRANGHEQTIGRRQGRVWHCRPVRLAGRHRVLVDSAGFGIFWGAWGAALPSLQRRSGADDGELGIALVLVSLGALVSMCATGVLLDWIGPRLTPATIAALAADGALPELATSRPERAPSACR